MNNLNVSGSGDYSTGPRGAAVRDSGVISGNTTRATTPYHTSRQVKIELSSQAKRGSSSCTD